MSEKPTTQSDNTQAPEPWERQEGETAKAYAAFSTYRDMSPHERSVLAAYKLANPDKAATAKCVPAHWRGWNTTYDWEARAEAYDKAMIQSAHRDRLEALDNYYRDEIDHGKALCELGRTVIDMHLDMANDERGMKPKLAILIPFMEGKAAKTALDAIKLGSDLQQRAMERQAMLSGIMGAPDPATTEGANTLTEAQRAMVNEMWEAVITRAKAGDTSAITLFFDRIGLIPGQE